MTGGGADRRPGKDPPTPPAPQKPPDTPRYNAYFSEVPVHFVGPAPGPGVSEIVLQTGVHETFGYWRDGMHVCDFYLKLRDDGIGTFSAWAGSWGSHDDDINVRIELLDKDGKSLAIVPDGIFYPPGHDWLVTDTNVEKLPGHTHIESGVRTVPHIFQFVERLGIHTEY